MRYFLVEKILAKNRSNWPFRPAISLSVNISLVLPAFKKVFLVKYRYSMTCHVMNLQVYLLVGITVDPQIHTYIGNFQTSSAPDALQRLNLKFGANSDNF